MKFGIVVSVCTTFLNRTEGSSDRKMANTAGSGVHISPRKLITSVFFNTEAILYQSWKINLK